MKRLAWLLTFICFLSLYSCNEEYNILEELKTPVQEFFIPSYDSITIMGKNGIKIHFEEGTFNGNIKDTSIVVVKLKEFIAASDLVFNGLETLSNDKIIQTKGMLHIEFLKNDILTEPLKEYMIFFPDSTDKKGYLLFTGKVTNQRLNWTYEKERVNTTVGDTLIPNSLTPIQDSLFIVYTTMLTGWFNCDMYWKNYTVCKSFKLHSKKKIPSAYILFKDVKAGFILPDFNGMIVGDGDLPIGETIDIIVITEDDGEIYWWVEKNYKIQDSNDLFIDKLSNISILELKEEVNKLGWK